jgi:hypothetical protein
MAIKKLPTGLQSFRKLREGNRLYVDKTELIHQLCTTDSYYFLSRPRRFGKSLLLSTLNELFSGSRELFEGLWIENQWDWSQKHPIIHLSFNTIGFENKGLAHGLEEILLMHYNDFGIIPPENTVDLKRLFFNLIRGIYDQQGKVVILIDEYDKAITDYMEIHKMAQAKANLEILGLFYGALKDADAYIRFLFITGVSKFSQVSLFSKLNNLTDLTTLSDYATLCGYTQAELEHYFPEYIDIALAKMTKFSRESLLETMKIWYNGYSWDGEQRVYNPFGILQFFTAKEFKSFWFATSTPTFLIKRINERGFYHLENIETDIDFLNQYSLENIELTSLLFQTGYLTIKEKGDFGSLVLSYPNIEVKRATYNFIISDMAPTTGGGGATVMHMRQAFLRNDLERVQQIFVALFGNLTYDLYQHQKTAKVEAFYHGLIHIVFKFIGMEIRTEVHTNKGRADAIVETPSHVYFLEFKMNEAASVALEQIKDRKYFQPYAADHRQKIGIGINFNSTEKEMDVWKVAEL